MNASSVLDRLVMLHPTDRPRSQMSLGELFQLQRPATPQPEFSLETAVNTAYREGFADGRKEAAEAAATEHKKIQEQTARQMEVRLAEISGQVTASIDAGIARMHTAIAASAARLLRPMLRRAVSTEAIDALTERLRECLPKKSHVAIRVQGPSQLIEAIAESLQNNQWACEIVPSDAIDVRVEFDETILETRIGEWLSAIEAAP